ncbi:MAG: glycerol-3-phosphate dehydrogenase, partial [Candidatus Omnitrophica bacterium CG11_big_fil_rev_8_21_14_0_20_64_10]
MRTGLALYKLLSGGAQVGPHRWLSAGEALAIEPGLARTGLVGGGLYADCQMDDARHCLENILQAGEAGAVCLNYLRVENFLKAAGRLCGAVVQDRLTGRLLEISSKAVISAVGPWGDQIRKLAGESGPERLAPTKGIHLVLPRRIHHGLFIEARRDRRMLFLLPWGMVMLAGTTESAVSGDPGALHAAADEVGYLLEEINRALPEVHFSESDVITTFAGARPLLRFSGLANAASRSHRIEEGAGGLISVMGGKYTTYRRMAAETVDFLVRRFRLPAEPGATGRRPLIPAWD